MMMMMMTLSHITSAYFSSPWSQNKKQRIFFFSNDGIPRANLTARECIGVSANAITIGVESISVGWGEIIHSSEKFPGLFTKYSEHLKPNAAEM